MAFQNPVVKNQVNAVVLVANGDALLPRFKTKTIAQFK